MTWIIFFIESVLTLLALAAFAAFLAVCAGLYTGIII